MAKPSDPFVLFRDDPAGRDVLFEQPSAIISADMPGAFYKALETAEAARRDGKWLAGYFSYEAGYLLEPKLVPLLPKGRRTPLVCLGVFDAPSDSVPPRAPAAPSNGPIFDAQAAWTFADYEKRFNRLHGHLRAGDCYQGNLTFPIHAHWTGEPLAAFEALTARQPVKYGALVDLGGPVVLSRSPELFFEIGRDGWIETHPMKGTAPRGATKGEDIRLREELRNDVSLISEVGTLDVPELFRIESYPTLHQMVSRVRAKLLPDLSIRDIFAALFPCGSITGAPKIRAMEILHDLEGTPRDVYCGAIGWIAPGGPMRFSVAIRTISLFPNGEAVYNVGGGIVFDSTAEAEYQECLLKARYATGTVPASN